MEEVHELALPLAESAARARCTPCKTREMCTAHTPLPGDVSLSFTALPPLLIAQISPTYVFVFVRTNLL